MDPLYELALSVKAGHRELDRRIGDLMRPLGLTAQQADALYVIGKAEPLSLKELGGLLIAEAGNPRRIGDRQRRSPVELHVHAMTDMTMHPANIRHSA